MNLLSSQASPTIWPWFQLGNPHFSHRKLTRIPNLCPYCLFEMVDIGECEIVYKCFSLECQDCVARGKGPDSIIYIGATGIEVELQRHNSVEATRRSFEMSSTWQWSDGL
jgi:hypothetical protein